MQVGMTALPFSQGEYLDRLERTRAEMERRGLDFFIVNSPVSINYLTGLETGTSLSLLVLPLKGEACIIVRKTELSNVEAIFGQWWVPLSRGVDDAEDPIVVLSRVINEICREPRQGALEAGALFLTAAHYLKLCDLCPGLKFADGTDIVGNLRIIKSPSELEYMRRAGSIAAGAVKNAIATIYEGMTDRELAINLISSAISLGSDPMPKLPYVTTGERTFFAHSSWNGSEIQRNDLINTEIACTVHHYNATVFRVSVIGEPGDYIRRLHDASLAGLCAGLENIGPGMTSHQADTYVREAIDHTGFGDLFVVRAAYGIGLGFPPNWSDSFMQIRPDDNRVLVPGMCFHLVPALYSKGVGAVCCSMSIEITENGCKPLTPIEPKLFVL